MAIKFERRKKGHTSPEHTQDVPELEKERGGWFPIGSTALFVFGNIHGTLQRQRREEGKKKKAVPSGTPSSNHRYQRKKMCLETKRHSRDSVPKKRR